MPATLTELIDLLDLEKLDEGLFRGRQLENTGFIRVFGGQVAAQALVAAQLTVPEERHVHSLHSYFLLGGDLSIPIIYDVENVRDGGSFTTRRVAARQHGAIIYYMTASFQKVEDGFDHQDEIPDVPSPDESHAADRRHPRRQPRGGRLVDQGVVGDRRPARHRGRRLGDATTVVPLRGHAARRPPAAQRRAHLLLRPHAARPHAAPARPGGQLTRHAGGLARPHDLVPPAGGGNQWFLYDQHSPSASRGRGLAIGRVFSEDGDMVATIAQEGLIRQVDPAD